ncbi:hypothetical protein TeGR_g3795, partial [Tetraparma gracilis]
IKGTLKAQPNTFALSGHGFDYGIALIVQKGAIYRPELVLQAIVHS